MGSIIPAIEENYRVAPGGKEPCAGRAVSGRSFWTLDSLVKYPDAFAYIGVFSSGYPGVGNDLTRNYELARQSSDQRGDTIYCGSPLVDRRTLHITMTYATLALFDQYGINYTFVQGTGGHVWNTWRHNLYDFAPLLFR